MTNLTPEQIREAVELAEGYQLTADGEYFSLPHGGYLPSIDDCPDQYIAALASQLISQVEADNEYYVCVLPQRTVIMSTDFDSYQYLFSALCGYSQAELLADVSDPNRDDNSILACTEFLRGR